MKMSLSFQMRTGSGPSHKIIWKSCAHVNESLKCPGGLRHNGNNEI